MKVIAFRSNESVVAILSVKELLNLSGFSSASEFNKAIGADVAQYSTDVFNDQKKKAALLEVDILVSDIYEDAKQTLGTYSELKNKLESVRNQLATLTKKMKPEE